MTRDERLARLEKTMERLAGSVAEAHFRLLWILHNGLEYEREIPGGRFSLGPRKTEVITGLQRFEEEREAFRIEFAEQMKRIVAEARKLVAERDADGDTEGAHEAGTDSRDQASGTGHGPGPGPRPAADAGRAGGSTPTTEAARGPDGPSSRGVH